MNYQKGIRAYVNKIDAFPQPRVDKNKEVAVPKEIRDLIWLKHLTAVHAYIAVPQCTYSLTAVQGREHQYKADIVVSDGVVLKDVLLTVPAITEPPVID